MPAQFIPIWLEKSREGATLAFAMNFPGTFGQADTEDHAQELLHRDLVGTRKWLASHGIADHANIDLPFQLVETVQASHKLAHGVSRAFFDWDAQHLDDEEIARAETILDASRSDLLSIVTPASQETLDIRLQPKTRTIREILRHMATMELWYVSCTFDDPLSAPSIYEFGNDLVPRLSGVRSYFTDQFLKRVRLMSPQRRMRQQLRDNELWTPRKAIRSALWHELYHLKQVYRMLLKIRRLPEPVRRAAVA